ncbi:MAG: YdhR family protein [Gemmatimonadota bacterium]|nr:YdhR family protein [Gemmatimonadota bacterium]MDH5760793.1 YdhR family protein [Gemmatimonadota bacterium]
MAHPSTVLLVRFKSSLSLEDVLRVANERIDQFRAIPGLLQKYYLQDPESGDVAGLYLWDSPESLREFGTSALRASIPDAYEIEGTPRIEQYQVEVVLRPE